MSHIDNINTSSWFVIANPTSGNRNFSKRWKEIQQLLKNKNFDYSFAFTQFSKHEVELAQNAIQKGFRNIISVGGDGTLHHVVNGVMRQRYVKTSNITIAVIPLGTGNDWIKTHNIPNSIKKAITIIDQRNIILQDIGILKTNKKTTFFNNVAGMGYDGYIVNKLKSLKYLGSVGYILSGLAGLLFYKKEVFKIIVNNKIVEEKCLMAVFGICKFSGGGMQFTKDVNVNNGILNITIAKNINMIDLIINIKKLYNGQIVNHSKVTTYQTKHITIIPKSKKPFIQADGELIATGSVTVTVVKEAIQFIVN
jgi:YegS/Rv2252/BmrU family lipid kinase